MVARLRDFKIKAVKMTFKDLQYQEKMKICSNLLKSGLYSVT